MSAEQNQSQTLFLRSEGILLVFFTAVAYAAFLLREMGYTNQFGLPHELINTSQVGLVSAAKAILFGVLGYTGKVNLVWLFTPRGDGFVATYIRKVIAVLLLIGFAMYPYCATDVSWWWFVGILAFFVFFTLIWPFITQRNITGYENKLIEQVRLESSGAADIPSSVLSRWLDRGSIITLGFVIAILIFAYGDGRRDGIEQNEFYIADAKPTWVVLRIYGDVIISAEFDPKSHKLSGLFSITKLTETNSLTMRRVATGKLQKAVVATQAANGP